MIITVSATGQLPKSGTRLMRDGSTRLRRPERPPTCGCCSAKYATANVPVMVMQNWIESVTSTPQRPDTDAKKMVIPEQTNSVCDGGQPSTTLAILAAAR